MISILSFRLLSPASLRALGLALAAALVGCNSTSQITADQIAQIRVGMAAPDLLEILGEPALIEPHPSEPRVEYWTFRRELTEVEMVGDGSTTTEYIDSFGDAARVSVVSYHPKLTNIEKAIVFLVNDGTVMAWKLADRPRAVEE